MLQRGNQYVDHFHSLCRETNLDPTHVPTMRRILLHLSQGLIEANLLMDTTTGCLLNKDEICASSVQIGKYAKTVKFLDKGLEKETNQKASREQYADLPCILDPKEQVKLEMLKQQCQQTKSPVVMFRKVVADRLDSRLRGIHLFHWDGTPRASPQDIINALCYYAPTKTGMSRAEKTLAGLAVAGAVGAGVKYYTRKQRPQHPQAVSPQDFRFSTPRTPIFRLQPVQNAPNPTQPKAEKWFWQSDEDEIRTPDQFRDFLERHKNPIVEKIGVKAMTHDDFMSLYKQPRNFYEIQELLKDILIANRKHFHKALTREMGTAVFIGFFQDFTCNTIANNQTFKVFMQKNNGDISQKMARLTKEKFDAKYFEKPPTGTPTGIQKLVEKFSWRLSKDVDDAQTIRFANLLKKTYEKKFGSSLSSWWWW